MKISKHLAVKQILRYLEATKSDGLYYWQKQPCMDLSELPLPTLQLDNNVHQNKSKDSLTNFHGAVGSDWTGDCSHRQPVTGVALHLAEGTILYKTKFQDCIATNSTEAEFIMAACDAGKVILYIRSI